MTLYICLEQGLRLVHPMMPFITEELWQRVTNRPGFKYPESVMLTSYPVEKAEWTNAKLDEDMELLNTMVHEARSLRSDYNLTRKDETDPVPGDDGRRDAEDAGGAEQRLQDAVAGGRGDRDEGHGVPAQLRREAREHEGDDAGEPEGSGGLLTRGLQKLQGQLKDVQSRKEKLEGKMNVESYAKVPAEVKERDAKKLVELKDEVKKYEESIARFEELAKA